jgi:hypothetical protein
VAGVLYVLLNMGTTNDLYWIRHDIIDQFTDPSLDEYEWYHILQKVRKDAHVCQRICGIRTTWFNFLYQDLSKIQNPSSSSQILMKVTRIFDSWVHKGDNDRDIIYKVPSDIDQSNYILSLAETNNIISMIHNIQINDISDDFISVPNTIDARLQIKQDRHLESLMNLRTLEKTTTHCILVNTIW